MNALKPIAFSALVAAICLSETPWLVDLYVYTAWPLFVVLFLYLSLGAAAAEDQMVKQHLDKVRSGGSSALREPGLLARFMGMVTLSVNVGSTAYAGHPALAAFVFITMLTLRGITANALKKARRIDRLAEAAASYDEATQTPV